MRGNSKAFTDGAECVPADERYRGMVSDNLCQSRSDGFRQTRVRSPIVREGIECDLRLGMFAEPEAEKALPQGRATPHLSLRPRERPGRNCWVVPRCLHHGVADMD